MDSSQSLRDITMGWGFDQYYINSARQSYTHLIVLAQGFL